LDIKTNFMLNNMPFVLNFTFFVKKSILFSGKSLSLQRFFLYLMEGK